MAFRGQIKAAQRMCGVGLPHTSMAEKSELADAVRGRWLPVGRAEELPEIGRYFTWERTGVPTLFVRSTDGEIRGFYNSCRHRGAPVVRTPIGRSRAFRCQYHSWTYDSFGHLLSIPDERDFGDIDRCAHGLVSLPIIERGGWLWADVDGNADHAATALAAYEPMQALQQSYVFQGRAIGLLDKGWQRIQPFVQRIAQDQNIAPNLAFDQREDRCYFLAIWPRDDWRLSVEVVTIGSEGTAKDSSHAQRFLDSFVAEIAASII